MRYKRVKKTRRNIDFFKYHYGFREPYQLLVDGNFCHVALQGKVHIKDQVPKSLGAKTKELVTPCVIEELTKLGPEFSGALYIAKHFEHRRCGHEEALTPFECLSSLVENGNPNRYIVASQDPKLREHLRQMAGVPILYLQLKTLLLEPPSAVSIRTANEIETKKTLPREDEKKVLEAAKPAKPAKKLKAPNPNSIRKKKKKVVQILPARNPPKDASADDGVTNDGEDDDMGEGTEVDEIHSIVVSAAPKAPAGKKKPNRRKLKRKPTTTTTSAELVS